jgi:hypothetical protein
MDPDHEILYQGNANEFSLDYTWNNFEKTEDLKEDIRK